MPFIQDFIGKISSFTILCPQCVINLEILRPEIPETQEKFLPDTLAITANVGHRKSPGPNKHDSNNQKVTESVSCIPGFRNVSRDRSRSPRAKRCLYQQLCPVGYSSLCRQHRGHTCKTFLRDDASAQRYM